METSLLNEFIVLADAGNYVTAAESLFLSQPTLSRHIKRLEEDLGAALFERNAGRLALTPEGQMFLPYAKKMLSVEKECRTALRQSSGSNHSALNIGTIPMMGAYGITDLIQRFQSACPDIVLHMNILSQREMRQALEDGRIDFAFLREFRKSEDALTRIPMAQDRIVLILPKSHPLAREKSLHLTQVKNEKLIFPAKDSDTYRTCVQACREAGFEPQVFFIGKGPQLAVDLVSRNMGIAFSEKLPCEYAGHSDQVVWIPVEPAIPILLSLACAGQKRGAAQTFLTFMKNSKKDSIFR